MSDRDRETLEETARWLEQEAASASNVGIRLLRERRAKAIRSMLEKLEAAEQNYATVYESAERAEQLWMEAQLERDEAREENERLRAHTKKCNDLVLRLARQAAKDQGFELEAQHDVQGIFASALQAGHDQLARIEAALAKANEIREQGNDGDYGEGMHDGLDEMVKALKGEGVSDG